MNGKFEARSSKPEVREAQAKTRKTMLALALVLVLGLAVVVQAEEVLHGVAVSPGASDCWVVTIESTAMYHSGDFGNGWQSQSVPTTRDFFDVFFLDSQNGWTCGRAGDIWHTTNSGDSWYRQNLAGPKYASRIQFVDAAHGWASGGAAIMLCTGDGGETWRGLFLRNPPYPADTVDFQGVSFADTIHGWLAAGRYPEGDSFTKGQGYIVGLVADADSFIVSLQRKDSVYDFFDVKFVDALNGWAVGGDDRTMAAVVFHTTNGGAEWTEQSVPSGARLLRAVKFASPTQGWACGRNGTIIHTSDAGTNWEQQTTDADTTLFDIDFGDSLQGMASGAGSTVLRTTDGGTNWERCYSAVAEPRPGTGDRGPGTGLRVLGNPARGEVSFAVSGSATGSRIAIFDASGRLVRVLSSPQSRIPDSYSLSWDGRNDTGEPVQAGLYLARLVSGDSGGTVRFVLLPR
ncbi:MAG: YCF48-related protein [candidate division WOR-3 bacterium]|nr:YCF48-related protein [candidate division WOR-3 bacterium]